MNRIHNLSSTIKTRTMNEWMAALGMLIGAVIHLWIMPEHLQHAPAHGIFFGVLGIAQLIWVGWWLWQPGVQKARLGLVLSGGVIVLWVLTQTVAIPFADSPESFDWATIVSKIGEAIALVALVHCLINRRLIYHPLIQSDYSNAQPEMIQPAMSRRGLTEGIVISLLSGALMLGGGMVAAPIFPALAHQGGEGHDHNDGTHSHGPNQTEAQATPSAAELAASTYAWELPRGFPLPTVPEENPITQEKIDLGRYLFYDTRLSGNNTQSCATCHIQALAFTDGRATPIGSTDMPHPRNAQSMTNVAYYSTYTWANPLLTTLERQIPVPMFGETPVELGITGNEEAVLTRLRTDINYQTLFAAAYPDDADPYTWQNIVYALASFARTLISGNSAYDRFVAGDTNTMTQAAKNGMSLFFSEALECHHCHTGFNFSASTTWQGSAFAERPFFNTGLYNIDGQGAYPPGNTGVQEVSNRIEDMGRFRPPSLRNIALTAPYMHDGSVATLEEVVRIYAAGGQHTTSGDSAGDGRVNPYKSGLVSGFDISDEEINNLVAFLLTLTDEEFITDPRFSDPFQQNAPNQAAIAP